MLHHKHSEGALTRAGNGEGRAAERGGMGGGGSCLEAKWRARAGLCAEARDLGGEPDLVVESDSEEEAGRFGRDWGGVLARARGRVRGGGQLA